MSSPLLVVIAGPTASGKTGLALELAEVWPAEIISADSRQVYRGMDIGTAKATAEERRRVPHHLLDVVDPDEDFTAADFARLGRRAAADVVRRGRLVLVVGGTGLYIRTLTEGLVDAPPADPVLRGELSRMEAAEGEGALHRRLQEVDPELAARLHPHDSVRIVRGLEVFLLSGLRLSDLQKNHGFGERPFSVLYFALSVDRDELYRRIDVRVERMFAQGLVEETEALLARGYPPGCKGMKTIGYKEVLEHLDGRLSREEAIAQIQQNSRRYAKRQLTWLRKEKSVIWLDSSKESDKIHALIENFMRDKRSGHG